MNKPKKKSVLNFFKKIECVKIFKKLDFMKKIVNSNKNLNFMKHKIICLSTPIAILLILIGAFIFNLCNDAYDFDAMIERTKTVITLPLKKAANSSTLNQIQQIASGALNTNCSAQMVTDYSNSTSASANNNFKDYILNKGGQQKLKLTAIKSDQLTTQQKNTIFSTLAKQFPNLIDNQSENNIKIDQLTDIQVNTKFWIQIAITATILVIAMLIYFGLKFKQLGFISTILVALSNLILTLGITFLIITMLTKRINLIFLMGVSIYFTSNLTIIFNEIKKQIKSKDNKLSPSETANKAIKKIHSQLLFTFIILITATLCCFTFSLIYDNYLVFYFAISSSISILVDLLTNTLFNAQLWVILKNTKFRKKKKSKLSLKKA